jgi:hypothetical protein
MNFPTVTFLFLSTFPPLLSNTRQSTQHIIHTMIFRIIITILSFLRVLQNSITLPHGITFSLVKVFPTSRALEAFWSHPMKRAGNEKKKKKKKKKKSVQK